MITDKIQCSICNEEKDTYECKGCSATFCFNHLTDHRQELRRQLYFCENVFFVKKNFQREFL